MAELTDMLKGIGVKLAGNNAQRDAKMIFDTAIKANTDKASSVAKIIGNVFMGKKYGAGLRDWIQAGQTNRVFEQINKAIANTDDLAKALEGTGLEKFADRSSYLTKVFGSAGEMAKSVSEAGRHTVASRFTNKAGEVGFWSVSRAAGRMGLPVAGVVAPIQLTRLAGNAVSMAIPNNQAAATQVAGQQW